MLTGEHTRSIRRCSSEHSSGTRGAAEHDERLNGWTAGEGRWMEAYRGESVHDPRQEDEGQDEREEPEAEREEPAEEPASRRSLTSRERARARLGSLDGCHIWPGGAVHCAVADRLKDLVCRHAGAGICRWCLAEFLVLSERGSAAGADVQARRLVAAQRLAQRHRRARSAA
jgi:hypothetical protein